MATKKRIPREANLPTPLFPRIELTSSDVRRLLNGTGQFENCPIQPKQAQELIKLLRLDPSDHRAADFLHHIIEAADTYLKDKFVQDQSRSQVWNMTEWKDLEQARNWAWKLYLTLKSLSPRTKRLVSGVRFGQAEDNHHFIEEVERIHDRLNYILDNVAIPDGGSSGVNKDVAAHKLTRALISIWDSAGNTPVTRSIRPGSYLHFAETVSETFGLNLDRKRLSSVIPREPKRLS